MRSMTIATSHPRVYLIDFEVAVEFPPDSSPEERVSVGYPSGGSLVDPDEYTRPIPPELTDRDRGYCPFKLDVWQLGTSFAEFSVCSIFYP